MQAASYLLQLLHQGHILKQYRTYKCTATNAAAAVAAAFSGSWCGVVLMLCCIHMQHPESNKSNMLQPDTAPLMFAR